MNPMSSALEPSEALESPRPSILLPIVLGMSVNLVSLVIGVPILMAITGLVVGLAATLIWSERPLEWALFTAVLAANPANTSTPIALNVLCAVVYFLIRKRSGWKSLPPLSQVALALVLLSTVVSILASLSMNRTVESIKASDLLQPWLLTWSGGVSMRVLISQVVNITNYLLGPFLFIPLIFSRIRQDYDPELLLKGMVFALILPTLLMFLLARTFGQPVMDANALKDSMLNVSTFQLGKLNIQMLRTQVGIILAVMICTSFAVVISKVKRHLRIMATGCLALAIYFLLVTGSVGSTLAALAGITLMLFMGMRHFSIKRYFILLTVGAGLALATWTILPQSIQRYATSRYEERIGQSGSPTADRSWRWKRSFGYLMENPSGVGWSLYIEPLGVYPHNDYLTYAIAFGLVCGLVYLFYPSSMVFSFIAFNTGPMEPSRITLVLAGAGAGTVLFINSMSDHASSNRWYFNVVWSLIWYAFFASRAPRRKPSPRTH